MGFHILRIICYFADMRKFLFLYVMICAAVGVAGAEPAAKESVDTIALQEVTVSAIKSSGNLAMQAVASTQIGQTEAERLNIVTLKGISDVVPNFYVPDYGSRITSSIYVRGLGARMDQPVVGFIVDNVPVMNKDAYDFDISAITGVTMLRGPQSTLYGRNTMGGVISVTTLSPMQWQGWKISGEYGMGNTLKATAGWYHRFSRKAALALSASASSSDGFFTNEYNGRKLDHEKLISGRAKFEWTISDRVRLQNTLSTSGLRQGGYPYEYIPTSTIAYNDTCFYRRFLLSDGVTVNWLHDKFRLSSITSVQHINDNMTLDQDFLPLDYFTLTQKKRETAFTQDVVLKGSVQRNYSWLLGAFGFYKHLTMNAPVTFHDYGIGRLIEDHRNAANPYYPIEWDARSFLLNSDFINPTYGLALYHESHYDVSGFRFTAGLRLDYEHSSLNYHSYCDTGYTIFKKQTDGSLDPYDHADIRIDERGELSRHFLELLPKLSVLYEIPTDCMFNVYASVTKGYKAGGFNTQMFSDVLQQKLMNIMGIGSTYDVASIIGYKPEKSWNYELGSKLESADGKLSAELSLFYIDCRDQQLTMFPDGSTTGRIMTNAGKTRSFGAELSASYRFSERVSVNGSYGFTDARFRKFYDGIADYAGKFIPYAPRNTLFLQAVWQIPLGDGFFKSLTFDANMRGTGRVYWNDSNSTWQNFYALLGASATLQGKGWQFQLNGENLTNTKYSTFYFVSIGNEFRQRGKPLRIGAVLRIDI